MSSLGREDTRRRKIMMISGGGGRYRRETRGEMGRNFSLEVCHQHSNKGTLKFELLAWDKMLFEALHYKEPFYI